MNASSHEIQRNFLHSSASLLLSKATVLCLETSQNQYRWSQFYWLTHKWWQGSSWNTLLRWTLNNTPRSNNRIFKSANLQTKGLAETHRWLLLVSSVNLLQPSLATGPEFPFIASAGPQWKPHMAVNPQILHVVWLLDQKTAKERPKQCLPLLVLTATASTW